MMWKEESASEKNGNWIKIFASKAGLLSLSAVLSFITANNFSQAELFLLRFFAFYKGGAEEKRVSGIFRWDYHEAADLTAQGVGRRRVTVKGRKVVQ